MISALCIFEYIAIPMASKISSLFGYKPHGSGAKGEPIKGLPASWYRSSEMYELERRAIFSKKWILVTHNLRFKKPGDFYRFEMAGFPFVLCLGTEGNLNGFHNICRHRAFPLISQDDGNTPILMDGHMDSMKSWLKRPNLTFQDSRKRSKTYSQFIFMLTR